MKRRKSGFKFILFFLVVFFGMTAHFVNAANNNIGISKHILNGETGDSAKGLEGAAKGAGFFTETEKTDPPAVLLGRYVQYALSLIGVVFLILIIYGGFIWMDARGREEETEKAKKIMTNAVIGLAVVLAGYAISYYIINNIANVVVQT